MSNELYRVKEYLVKHTGQLGKMLERTVARKWVTDILTQVDAHHAAGNTVSTEKVSSVEVGSDTKTERMRVIIAIHSLIIGGGEIFPIHLANALAETDAEVMIVNCGMQPENPEVRGMISEKVLVKDLKDYTEIENAANLFNADIIHTHHAMLDLAVSRMIEKKYINARHIVTLHGMYEALDAPRQALVVEQMCKSRSRFAYIAEKNLTPFRENGVSEEYIKENFAKIPNGLQRSSVDAADRAALGIPDDALVLCLVSRAIFEKGWEEAIRITRLANKHSEREVHLVLVGSGEAYDALKSTADPNIHFTGLQQNTRQYFAAADVGFLPSRYEGESFPLVIIDSLMCGKPVIATELGEIPDMLQTTDGTAGWTFPLADGKVPEKDIARLIVGLINHPDKYQKACENAVLAAEKYDIRKIADRYLAFYMNNSDEADTEQDELNVKVLVSCHKESQTLHNEVIRPIQVGCALTEKRFPNMLYDNEGDNISALNKQYCEVTGQYWAWKNLDADAYGFFHYRRYLNLSDRTFHEDRYGNVYEPAYSPKLETKYGLTEENLRKRMQEYDIITVKPRKIVDENGKPMSVMQQYDAAEYLYGKDLQTVLDIIDEKYPEYSEAAHEYCDGDVAYYCNMFILKKAIFNDYCEWLFAVLDEFCNRTDMTSYDVQQLRTPGHLAERLWGIYLTWLKGREVCKLKEVQNVVVASTDIEKKNRLMTPVINGLKVAIHRIRES